jgi:3-oxoacyl-[acyl-carrier-protein] synthase II
MPKRRVVVTGLGVVSSNGIGKDQFWEANIQGRSGIESIKNFDPSRYKTKIAAEVKDFNPLQFMPEQIARQLDEFSQFVIAGARMAEKDSALNLKEEDPYRMGVVIGSGLGGMFFYEKQILAVSEFGPQKAHPTSVPRVMPNAPAGICSIELNLKGPNLTVATACASGNHAIGQAYEMIAHHKADVIFAGGTEAPVVPYTFAAFDNLHVMSRRSDIPPQEVSRPFDRQRDGFVMGEGAGVLILEELDHALKRNAPLYAEIIGYGISSGAEHMVIPVASGEDAAWAMHLALTDAGISPQEVDYINAHGTSTPANDKAETLAIKNVFQEYAYKIPVSSTKSMIGHAVGAAGAIEAVVCCLVIKNNIIPPTINYHDPDPQCDLDYVPNEARRQKVDVVLSNSFGFGSNNATLIFRRLK